MSIKAFEGGKVQLFDKDTGDFLSLGKVYVYEPGTTTAKTSYTTSALSVANANPVILDAYGRAEIWVSGNAKFLIQDANGGSEYEVDNYNRDESGSSTVYNLAANGSFEIGTTTPDSWTVTLYTGGTQILDTAASTHGAQSIKFTSAGPGGGYITQSAFSQVANSQTYLVRFTLKSSVADVRNLVQVKWYDADQVFISNTTVYDNSTTNPTSFASRQLIVTAPSTAAFAKLELYGCHSSDVTTGSTWYDNVEFTNILLRDASTVVSVKNHGAIGDGVADDTTAITNAITAAQAGGGEVYLPHGQYRITTGSITLANVTLRGCGVSEKGSPYTDNGSVILLDSTSASPFALGRGVTIEGISFFYPNQDGSGASPTVYPALFAGTYISQFLMQNCTVVNAYTFFRVNTGSVGAGDIRFDNCRIYAIDKCFYFLNGAPDVIQINNCFFSFGVYEDVANVTPFYLRTHTATSGEFISIDCGAGSKTSVDGLEMSNTLVFGSKYGVRIVSGTLDVSTITGCTFDAVQTALSVEGTAKITHTSWIGNLFYSYDISVSTSKLNTININTTGAVSRALFSGNDFAYSYGNHFTDSTTGVGDLVITGNTFANWGQTTFATPADYYALALADSGINGTISGNMFKGLIAGSNNPDGVLISNNADVIVIGNQFKSCYIPLQVSGGSKARVIGNSSSSTGYTQSFIDSDAGTGDVQAVWNSWDKDGTVIAFPSFRAVVSAAQTFTGAKTKVQFANEIYDQDSNYDPTTHQFTIPVAGTYSFDMHLVNTTGVTVGDYWNAQIERTGAATQSPGHIQYVIADQVGGCSIDVYAQFVCAAGDVITAYMTRGGGAGNWVQLNDGSYNYFQGRRIQ